MIQAAQLGCMMYVPVFRLGRSLDGWTSCPPHHHEQKSE